MQVGRAGWALRSSTAKAQPLRTCASNAALLRSSAAVASVCCAGQTQGWVDKTAAGQMLGVCGTEGAPQTRAEALVARPAAQSKPKFPPAAPLFCRSACACSSSAAAFCSRSAAAASCKEAYTEAAALASKGVFAPFRKKRQPACHERPCPGAPKFSTRALQDQGCRSPHPAGCPAPVTLGQTAPHARWIQAQRFPTDHCEPLVGNAGIDIFGRLAQPSAQCIKQGCTAKVRTCMDRAALSCRSAPTCEGE